ncbi:MAG: hypothetical protein M3Q69_09265 [Acidobacteriota bacterium]|nr:hypothetical protein [Acidobacteriota bacterium]
MKRGARRRLVFALLAALLHGFGAVAGESLRFGSDAEIAPLEYADPGLATDWTRIATDEDGYLAVWTDLRRGAPSIYAARLTADAALRDPAGIYIGSGSSAEVVWNGASYLIAWQGSDGLRIATVTREGAVSESRLLHRGVDAFALASNGGTSLVATTAGVAYIVGPDLSVRAVAQTARRGTTRGTIAAAARPGQFLVAYVDPSGSVLTQTIDDHGSAGELQTLPDNELANLVSVASDGSSYYVIWTTAFKELRGKVISPENEGFARTMTLYDGRETSFELGVTAPHVVWGGGRYVAAFVTTFDPQRSGPQARLMTIRSDGTARDAAARVDDFPSYATPAVAPKRDGNGAVIWRNGSSVRVGLFTPTGPLQYSRLTVVNAASAAIAQALPSITLCNSTVVLAWAEFSAGGDRIRLGYNGRRAVTVAQKKASFLKVLVDAEIVLVWQDAQTREVVAERYSDSFLRERSTRLRLPANAVIESAAVQRGVLVFTWRAGDRPSDPLYLGRVVVSKSGTVQAPDVLLSTTPGESDGQSRVLWDDRRFVVAWRHVSALQQESIFVQRFERDGTKADAQPVRAYDAPSATIDALRATTSGARVILGWQERARDSRFVATFVARLEDGPLNPIRIDEHADSTSLQAVSMHRDGTLDVYWWTQNGDNAVITANRLSPELVTLARTAIEPFVAPHGPSFAATATGATAIFLYGRLDASPEAGYIDRIFVRDELAPWMKQRHVW